MSCLLNISLLFNNPPSRLQQTSALQGNEALAAFCMRSFIYLQGTACKIADWGHGGTTQAAANLGDGLVAKAQCSDSYGGTYNSAQLRARPARLAAPAGGPAAACLAARQRQAWAPL